MLDLDLYLYFARYSASPSHVRRSNRRFRGDQRRRQAQRISTCTPDFAMLGLSAVMGVQGGGCATPSICLILSPTLEPQEAA